MAAANPPPPSASPELRSEVMVPATEKPAATPRASTSAESTPTKGESGKAFKCEECGKEFKKHGWFERHKCKASAVVPADSTPSIKRKRTKSKRAAAGDGAEDADATESDVEAAATAAKAALLTAAVEQVENVSPPADTEDGAVSPVLIATRAIATNKRQKTSASKQKAAEESGRPLPLEESSSSEKPVTAAATAAPAAAAPATATGSGSGGGADSAIDVFDFEDYDAKLDAQRKEVEELRRDVERLKASAAAKIARQKAEYAQRATEIAELQKQRAALTRIVGIDAK